MLAIESRWRHYTRAQRRIDFKNLGFDPSIVANVWQDTHRKVHALVKPFQVQTVRIHKICCIRDLQPLTTCKPLIHIRLALVLDLPIVIEARFLRCRRCLTVNSIRLAQSRESRDACAHGRHSQTDLVGGNRALPITSFAHMGRFRSREEIHTRMNNTPAAVSVSKV
jgi:hypothetical protein